MCEIFIEIVAGFSRRKSETGLYERFCFVFTLGRNMYCDALTSRDCTCTNESMDLCETLHVFIEQ